MLSKSEVGGCSQGRMLIIMFVLFAVSAIILLTESRCESGMKMMTSSLVSSRD